MTSISIPAGVEQIDPAFFQLFPNAASVTVAGDNPHFQSFNGMLLSEQMTSLLLVPEGMEGVAVLPESLATVPAYVISRCKKLYGLSFQPGSTGNNAFTTQDGVLYTNDLTTLLAAPAGIGASVAIAPECTAIAEGAFWGNDGLKTIISNGDVSDIAAGAENAESEADAPAPASAFAPATIETGTVITEDRSAWEAAGFTHFAEPAKPGDATTLAPDESGFVYTLMEDGHLSVKWVGDAPATGERTIVESATLHGVNYTVTTIEDGAFRDQTELTKLTLPSTITSIGDSAFAGCTALGSIQIPGSTISIGASAFEGCTSLASIALGSGLRTIGERAFAGTALPELILPASVQSIGSSAFAGCEQLRTIVARGTVAHVSETALADTAGVSIYAPYAEDGDYTWNIGPVASANHLLPYGARTAQDIYQLTVGDELNAFEGGYLHAPEGIEATVSYKASIVNADATGYIVARQPGISTVTYTIAHQDIELAKATCSVTVRHAVTVEPPNEAPIGAPTEQEGSSDAIEDEFAKTDEADDGQDAAPLDTTATQPQDNRPSISTGEYVVDEEALKKDAEQPAESTPPIHNQEVQVKPTDEGVAEPAGIYSDDTASENEIPTIAAFLSGTKMLLPGSFVSDEVPSEYQDSDNNLLGTKTVAKIMLAAIEARATYGNDCQVTVMANGGSVSASWSDANWTNLGSYYKSASGTNSFVQNHHGNKYHNTWTNCKEPGDKEYGILHTYAVLTNTPSGTYVEPGTNLKRLQINARKTGYFFTGWYLGAAANATPLVSASSGNVSAESYHGSTIYPHWKARTYTITFNNSGTKSANTTTKATYDMTCPAVTPPTPADGYSFQGYYTGVNGSGNKIYDNKGQSTAPYRVNGNLTLYAYSTPIGYKLAFNAQGGKFSNGEANTSIDFNYTTNGIALPTPTRTDWTFVGWEISGALVTAGSGSGLIVDGETYRANTPAYISNLNGDGWWGNATFNAVWRCTLKLDCSKPGNSPEGTNNHYRYYYYYSGPVTGSFFSQLAKTGLDVAKITTNQQLGTTAGSAWVTTADLPSAKAYEFKGWQDVSTEQIKINEQGKLKASLTSINGDTTWYAKFDAITYKITLLPNGGTMPSGKDTTIEYTKGQTEVPFYSTSTGVSDYTPRRSNWTFMGWRCTAYDETMTDPWVTSGKPYKNFYTGTQYYGSYTLEAVWSAELKLSGNAPTSPISTTVTQSFKGPIYYYTGYGFSTSASPVWDSTSSFITNLFTGGRSKPTCSDSGWEFFGYYNSDLGESYHVVAKDGTLQTRTSGSPSFIEGNATLNADWIGKEYTVTLDPNTGTQSTTTTIKYTYGTGYSAMGPTQIASFPGCANKGTTGNHPIIPIPTKEGWTFAGYYLDSLLAYDSCSSTHNYWNPSPPTHLHSYYIYRTELPDSTLKGDKTLTAKWTRNIPIDANGGTQNDASKRSVTATYGEKLPYLDYSYVPSAPAGWSFYGFADRADWSDKDAVHFFQYAGGGGLYTLYDEAITTDFPEKIYTNWWNYLSIDANGGEGGQSNVRIWLNGSGEKIASVPQREGYTLAGFSTSKEAGEGTQVYDAGGAWTKNISTAALPTKVYAQWTADKSYIKFDANGGTGGPADLEGVTNQEIADRTLPSTVPAKPDYSFSYWSTDVEGDNEIEQLPEKFPVGTLTLYAQYEEKPLSIVHLGTYGDDYGGGTLTTYHAAGLRHDEFSLRPDTGVLYPKPTAVPDQGYEFVGWFKADESGNQGELMSTDATWAPDRPEGGWPTKSNYVAHFEQIEYTIKYGCAICRQEIGFGQPMCKHVHTLQHAVDGVYQGGLPTSFKYKNIVDEQYAIKIGVPGMAIGYEFAGWSGTDVLEGNPESFQISTLGNKIYYVHPKATEYTLTLDANVPNADGVTGGWVDGVPDGYEEAVGTGDHPSIKRTYTIETSAFQLPQPVWAGHTFDGWELNGQPYSGITFTPGRDNYGDKTLTATWSTNAYQITYELGDDLGTGALPEGADNPLNYSYDSRDIALPIPSRVGYDFTGWTEESISDNGAPALTGTDPQIDVTIPAGSWGDRVFKAHWRAHKYNVAFDLGGGSWGSPQPANPLEATYDADVTIPAAPKRPGYLFCGWQLALHEGESESIMSLSPGQVVERPNWVAEIGEPARDGVPENKGGTITIEALWKVNIEVEVAVGSDGVHMGLERKADTRDPFTTTRGEAVLRNHTDAPVKVVSVVPNQLTDFEELRANAEQLFRDESSLHEVGFTVRPSVGTAPSTQAGRFALADANGSFTLRQDSYLNGNPTHTFARNWMMDQAGTRENELHLYYELDMGSLKPEDVNLTQDVDLRVSDLVYTVALVCP